MITNTLVYAAGAATGLFAFAIVPSGPGMTLGPVVLVSALAGLAGVGTYAVIARRSKRPWRVFAIVAALVLLASFVAPLAIPALTRPQLFVVELMHVTAAACVFAVARRARSWPAR